MAVSALSGIFVDDIVGLEALAEHGPLLIAHPGDVDVATGGSHSGNHGFHPVGQSAGRGVVLSLGCEHDSDVVAVDLHRADHVEFGYRFLDFRLEDSGQCGDDSGFGDRHGRGSPEVLRLT